MKKLVAKVKNMTKETKAKLWTYFWTGIGFITCAPVTIYADVGDDIAGGIKNITNVILRIVNPIAVLAVVIIGIYCIMAENEQAKSKAKSWLIWIVIGLILINLAQPLVDTLSGIGKQ